MWSSLKRRFRRDDSDVLPSRMSGMEGTASTEGHSRSTLDLIYMLEAGPPPDVGERIEDQQRRRKFRPTLVNIGSHAGESRVHYNGHNIPLHLITKDFFITVVQLDTIWLFCMVAAFYLVVYMVWSFIWWLIVRFYPGCLYGATNYVDALAFSVVTQMTIGYGNTGPQSCWAATWLIVIQSIIAVLLEAIVLGIVFARISHPHQRSRSIFMSNKAIVARRDGILKFMFRVADIRNAQVVEPKVRAYLYTWGDGRITAEGERIPVRVEPLEVDYIDGMLLLPLIIEHTVDERSPLCGHTHTSLAQLNAEVVVTFEGTTEMGNPFMARRSYIPEEIFWGYQFSNVVGPPPTGAQPYTVQLDNFHKIERQKDMPDLHPAQLSQLVVNRAKRTVPYPLLGENTLVLSDVLCVAPNEDGNLCLMCRVGDTYPNQMLEITARMYFYRWADPVKARAAAVAGEPDEEDPCEQFALDCGYQQGVDRLYLRLPHVLTHIIDADSPLAAWREPGGLEADACSEVVVVINAYMNVNTHNILRQRTYSVDHHMRYGYRYMPIVRHPALARDLKPRVKWQNFHRVMPAEGMEKFPPPPVRTTLAQTTGMTALSSRVTSSMLPGSNVMSIAPESHAGMRSSLQGYSGLDPSSINSIAANLARNEFTVLPMDLQRYAQAVGGDTSQAFGTSPPLTITAGMQQGTSFRIPEALARYAQDTLEASDSLPHAAALHPALPGPDRFRESDQTELNMKSDYTVLPMDLHRYSMAVAGGGPDSPPPQRSKTFVPLPADFKETAAAAAQSISPAQSSGAERPSLEGLSGTTSGGVEGESTAPPPPPAAAAAAAPPAPAPGETEDSGPLAGVHIVTRTVSQAVALGEGEGEDAGPMHFASSKNKKGGKSYVEISSLFNPSNEDDEEEGEEVASKAEGAL